MRKLLPLAALLLLLVAGCSGTSSPVHPATITYIPPTSSITPEGAKPQSPPKTVGLAPGEKTIDTAGLHLIEGFEGYSRCAYWDPFGRVYTAGFGQTRGIHAGFCFASRAAAEGNLRASVVREYEWAVHAVSRSFGQHAVDALDSFAYNLGAGIFTGTLHSDLARHAYYAAGNIMLGYDHAGGQVLAGLRTRRILEVRLLRTPDPKPKPKRLTPAQAKAIEHQINLLRVDIAKHGCTLKPYHGRGKYHAICKTWLAQGQADHRRLAAG